MSPGRRPGGGTGGGQGAKEQLARLLTLVPFLHSHGQARVDDAARALGVTPAQVVRDLKVLLMCGLPGGYPDDLIDVDLDALEGPEADGTIRVSNADYLARPLRLTSTEATAMIVALRALREGAGDETREVVDRALAKLESSAADSAAGTSADSAAAVASRVVAGGSEIKTDLTQLAARLAQAARDRVQVEIRYYVPSRDEESLRVVDPRGVATWRGTPYLDAWCHQAEAPRLFRLDRIAEARVLDVPIATEPEGPRDLDDGLFDRSADAARVRLLLDPPAQWIVEYYPVERVRSRGRRLEATLVVVDPSWLTRLLLRLAPHVRVVEPGDAAADAREAARRALDLYEDTRPPAPMPGA